MKVLIADDNGTSRLILRSHLRKWGYEVIEAEDGSAAWAILHQPDAPRLAILDWVMPGKDGVEICRQLRATGEHPYTYVILLTGRDERDDMVAGLDAGADDYIIKPFHAQELRVRVRAGERICQLQAELLAARETLRHQATHDPLTGCWNRGAILDLAERERRLAQRTDQPLALAMIDFDHFKRVNDRYGHLAGDTVLREGTARIARAVRGTDLLGRYGGEEFLMVLPACDPEATHTLAEGLRQAVSGSPILHAGTPITASVSVGIASWDGEELPALIHRADQALYRAKHAGRDRVELASPLAIPA